MIDEEEVLRTYIRKAIRIVEDNKETEVPEDDEMMKQLSKLMEDYKQGKINKEEFAFKKAEILK